MRKAFIGITVIFTVITMIMITPMTACAAEEGNPTVRYAAERIALFGSNGKYFDYVAYADTYPDLYAVFGYNKKALWNHYVNNGVYEGRRVSGTTQSVNARLIAYNALTSITHEGMSDREKVTAIHNWIVNTTKYDYMNYLANTIPDISYTKEGVFLNHVAVCAGYADAFNYMASIAGIKCECVDGYAGGGGHAWNRVFVDNTWLYVDCTWDDPVCSDGSDMLTYNYFLISEEAIGRDHSIASVYKLY